MKKFIIVGAVIVASVVAIRFTPSDPEPRITSMCEGYYRMINRHFDDLDVSSNERENACEAAWVAIEGELTREELDAYVDFTFKRNKPGPTPPEMTTIAPKLRDAAFEGSCEWAKTAEDLTTDPAIFCAPLSGFAMY